MRVVTLLATLAFLVACTSDASPTSSPSPTPTFELMATTEPNAQAHGSCPPHRNSRANAAADHQSHAALARRVAPSPRRVPVRSLPRWLLRHL